MKNAILNLATSALYIHENTVYLQQKSKLRITLLQLRKHSSQWLNDHFVTD